MLGFISIIYFDIIIFQTPNPPPRRGPRRAQSAPVPGQRAQHDTDRWQGCPSVLQRGPAQDLQGEATVIIICSLKGKDLQGEC